MRILPYKFGSQSGRSLSQALGVPRVRHAGQFRNNFNHTILNWGSSQAPVFPASKVVNNFGSVIIAANKLLTMRSLTDAGVPTLEWTTDQDVAQGWLEESTVIGRKLLTSHSGRGIIILEQGGEIENALLYTRYFKKKVEYRVHVMGGEVIDVQEKRKRSDAEYVDYRVRNHGGGFVFCRDGVEPPACVIDASILAVTSMGLDFGAVDVGYNSYHDTCAVFEVNTAPALEGTTLQTYSTEIRRRYL